MAAEELGLLELIAPSYLAGSLFDSTIEEYLDCLKVDTLRTCFDGSAVVYIGRASIQVEGEALSTWLLPGSDGSHFHWEDLTVDFRLTIPRDGSHEITIAADMIAEAGSGSGSTGSDIGDLLEVFGEENQREGNPTEYPGTRFRLELMFSCLTFCLGDKWKPGEMRDGRIILDSDKQNEDVKIVLPNIIFEWEQGDGLEAPDFSIKAWGQSGFDGPADLLAGELIRMEPPLAVNQSGDWGFALDRLFLDLSEDYTPPEILANFGTDEGWQGLYIKHLRLYYNNDSHGIAVNGGVENALISFAGEVSMDISLDILGNDSPAEIILHLVEDGARRIVDENVLTSSPESYLQVSADGGSPPFTYEYAVGDPESAGGSGTPFNPDSDPPRQFQLSELFASRGEDTTCGLTVNVSDAEGALTVRKLTIVLSREEDEQTGLDGNRGDNPVGEGTLADIVYSEVPPPGYALQAASLNDTQARVRVVTPGETGRTVGVEVDGTPTQLDEGNTFVIDIGGGISRDIQVTLGSTPSSPTVCEFYFDRDRPLMDPDDEENNGENNRDVRSYIENRTTDHVFNRRVGEIIQQGNPAQNWISWRVSNVERVDQLDAYASYDSHQSQERYNQYLSERRQAVVEGLLALESDDGDTGFAGYDSDPHGFSRSDRSYIYDPDIDRYHQYRRVDVSWVLREQPEVTFTATLTRNEPGPPSSTSEGELSPDLPENEHPDIFKRLSLRLRLERNIPVLIEISGLVDIETKAEKALRNRVEEDDEDNDVDLPGDEEHLGLENLQESNPGDGLLEFTLNVTYDAATQMLSEKLAFGSGEGDRNGLVRMRNSQGDGDSAAMTTFKDIFGAILIFAPIINETASEAAEDGSTGDWVAFALSTAVPITAAALGFLPVSSVTLYGAELKSRQHVPRGDDASFSDLGILLDYGVEFGLDIANILETQDPMKVRYRGVGFNLNRNIETGEWSYQPIFDTSKGYELDLADLGNLALPGRLGDLFSILGARIARLNPVTLEVDLGFKVDLGILSVDTFKIKWPIERGSFPTILPSGIGVDIPGTLTGNGSVEIIRNSDGENSGFSGSIDLSLVPVKLRIAASISIVKIDDGPREVTAVYFSLGVEFPTPIVLAQSGLGIFGFHGLFAMHYRRVEGERQPGESMGPALQWLDDAGGEPNKLVNDNNGKTIWEPCIDRWSFGVGALIGSLEGGYLVNLHGTFVLELPGPRILIFVKLQIISQLPDTGESVKTGILGVLDLDFERGRLTIGVLIDLCVDKDSDKKLLEIKIPIEFYAAWKGERTWHLWIGTITEPVSANILNIVKANGYLMIDGSKISNFPLSKDNRIELSPVAFAVGIQASLVFGNKRIRLYLEVAAGVDLAVSFSRKNTFMAGRIWLKGEFHLFFIGLAIEADLSFMAPRPVFFEGRVKASLDLFFFTISGSVHIQVGDEAPVPENPPLMVTNVYLQSYAPVIATGQAGERPIDASLGNAVAVEDIGTIDEADVPTVPIDSLIVVQLLGVPEITDDGIETFTKQLPCAGTNYWGGVGGNTQVKYILRSLRLWERESAEDEWILWAPDPDGPGIPAVWRTLGETEGKSIELAIFTRTPNNTPFAFERSAELTGQVRYEWEGLCTPVARPAPVLWTFMEEPLGPSEDGWLLKGAPLPDPPDTSRYTEPPLYLSVKEPEIEPVDNIANSMLAEAGAGYRDPARVIGQNGADDWQPSTTTIAPPATTNTAKVNFGAMALGSGPNPRKEGKIGFLVMGRNNRPERKTKVTTNNRIKGLYCSYITRVTLPKGTCQVDLVVAQSGRIGAKVVAYDKNKRVLDRHRITQNGRPEKIRFTNKKLAVVVIESGTASCLLLSCSALLLQPGIHISEHPELVPSNQSVKRRALQLPRLCIRHQQDDSFTDYSAFTDAREERDETFWVEFETDAATMVRIFLAVDEKLFSPYGLICNQLGLDNHIVRSDALTAMGPTLITGTTTGLPAEWLDPSLPWIEQVEPVAEFLATNRFNGMKKLLLTLRPDPQCRKVQLKINNPMTVSPHVPGVVVGAIEVLRQEEVDRTVREETYREGRIETVEEYLASESPVPLLMPGRQYRIDVAYDVYAKNEDDVDSAAVLVGDDIRQSFCFNTDESPPRILDAYVLGTYPGHEQQFHFRDDPIVVCFNDRDAVSALYQGYGYNLQLALRSADGDHVEPVMVNTAELEEIPAEFLGPYYEALAALVDEALPCVGREIPFTRVFRLATRLKPLMGYTVDLEMVADDGTVVSPGDEDSMRPLFRKSFSTSRYNTMEALAADINSQRIRHRYLPGSLRSLVAGSNTTRQISDVELEQALAEAGDMARPAAGRNGITLLWNRQEGEEVCRLSAILIDAIEPLWRVRKRPKRVAFDESGIEIAGETEETAGDYQQIRPGFETAMEVGESITGGMSGMVSQFIYNTSGTRTIAIIDEESSSGGEDDSVCLSLYSSGSDFYGLDEKRVELVTIYTGYPAPWEEE